MKTLSGDRSQKSGVSIKLFAWILICFILNSALRTTNSAFAITDGPRTLVYDTNGMVTATQKVTFANGLASSNAPTASLDMVRLTDLQGATNYVALTNILNSFYVQLARTITAGDGLTGGGDLSANRSFAVDGSVLRTNSTSALTNILNSFYVQLSRSVTAGSGLLGGGTLAADRTFSLDWSTMQSTNDLRYVPLTRTLTAGDGLSGGGDLSANRSLAVDSSVVRTSLTLSVSGPITGGGNLSANRSFGFDGSVAFNASGATNVPAANVNGTLPTSTFSTGGDARYQKLDGSNSGTGVYTNSSGFFVDNVFDTVLKKLFGNWTVTGSLVASNGFEFYGTGIIGTVGSSTPLTDNKVTLFGTNTYFSKTATFSNTVVNLDNITGSGTDNTLNNQTLTGNGSVMTRTLADTRYLQTFSPVTMCMVNSGDSVNITNSSISVQMPYGTTGNTLIEPGFNGQWLKAVYLHVQDSGTLLTPTGLTNISLQVTALLTNGSSVTLQDWINADGFLRRDSANQFVARWSFANQTVVINTNIAKSVSHSFRFDGTTNGATVRLNAIAIWHYPTDH